MIWSNAELLCVVLSTIAISSTELGGVPAQGHPASDLVKLDYNETPLLQDLQPAIELCRRGILEV